MEPVKKRLLETIIHKSFLKSPLLIPSIIDNVKDLGFYYATVSGFSIGFEDFINNDKKNKFLSSSKIEVSKILNKWYNGQISNGTKLNSILKTWEKTSNVLLNNIDYYFNLLNKFNPLNVMVTSGARGNWPQMHQIINLRGLIVDQNGNIIDTPILSCLKEGLSILDYLISAYGTRKGIIDTSLKTADAGYLTRRLIFVTQDIIVKTKDCVSKQHVFSEKCLINSFTSKKKKFLKISFFLNGYRRPLTCNTIICQKCYGVDLSKNRLVSLGLNVGIISAQSVGEPGTQMTLKTFHTGGAFLSENYSKNEFQKTGLLTTEEPVFVNRIVNEINLFGLEAKTTFKIILRNWKGLKNYNFFDEGGFINSNKIGFFNKNIKNITYSDFVPFLKKVFYETNSLNYGKILLKSAIIKEFNNNYKLNNSISALLKTEGFLEINALKTLIEKQILIYNIFSKYSIKKAFSEIEYIYYDNKNRKFDFIIKNDENDNTKIKNILLVKNKQYRDIGSIIATDRYFIFSNKKFINFIRNSTLFESAIFTLFHNSTFNYEIFLNKFFKKNHIYKEKILLDRQSILFVPYCKYVEKSTKLAVTLEKFEKTDDIIQGIPKIEELLIGVNLTKNLNIERLRTIHFNYCIIPDYIKEFFFNCIKNDFSLRLFLKNKKRIKLKKDFFFFKFCSSFNSFFSKNNNFYYNSNISKQKLMEIQKNEKKININNFISNGNFINIDNYLKNEYCNMNTFLLMLFNYHEIKDGNYSGLNKSLTKFQLILVNAFLAIYITQNIKISAKHFEIISKQLTSLAFFKGLPFILKINECFKVNYLKIKNFNFLDTYVSCINNNIYLKKNSSHYMNFYKENFYSVNLFSKHQNLIRNNLNYNIFKFKSYLNFFQNDLINVKKINLLNKSLINSSFITFKTLPSIFGVSELVFQNNSFLSEAGFNNSASVLADAAIYGKFDWINGSRENIIISPNSSSGTSFMTQKEFFNNLYFFKE